MYPIRMRVLPLLLALVLVLGGVSRPAEADEPAQEVSLKNSPQFLDAFRSVTARASHSTVRVRCAGKDVALGTVVGADGLILTKASELSGPAVVVLADGRRLPARVVGVHSSHDLALLAVKAHGLTPVVWRPSSEVAVGHWAVSAGPTPRPVAVGVVSVGRRELPSNQQPLSEVGYLGISLEPVPAEARISRVFPRAAAARAGLQPGDLILAVAGKPVHDADSFLQALRQLRPGDEVALRLQRDEEELNVRAKLGQRPPDRGEFQNRLGSELSRRRGGFATVLQHDSVIRPADCGGPLVALDGRAIGINICRAGRTESLAIPSEVVLALLPELRTAGLVPAAR